MGMYGMTTPLTHEVTIARKWKKNCSELSFDIMKELPQFRFIDSDMTPKEATPNDYFFICLSPSDIYLFDHDINIDEFKPKYFYYTTTYVSIQYSIQNILQY